MRRWLLLLLLVIVTFIGSGTASAMAAPATFVPLSGDGSSWAEPAIDQFSRDVVKQGINVQFVGDGSAAGRLHYIENQADFAASDIPFLTSPDPFGGGIETPNVAYSYVPIVAGGTAFMYNLTVGTRKITNLRLSGATIAKIFTGVINNWDDPAITKDYGAALPSQKITVVTRSDGSGASYQFTRWMSKQYPAQWGPFCTAHNDGKACNVPTEFYPGFTGSIQQSSSSIVASYIASSKDEGSIGYDEYSYAKLNGIPVVSLLNPAGYFIQPTDHAVAIALQAAQIDENPASLTYLIQNLDNVYTNPDPRSYPLSSYSYLIVPRASRVINGNTVGPPARFNTAKGATLSSWLNYVLCGAQAEAGALGYSALPRNLALGGFAQVANIPGAVPPPDLANFSNCKNPNYYNGVNLLIKEATFPTACQKYGSPLNCSLTPAVVNGKKTTVASAAGTSGGSGTGPGTIAGTGTVAGKTATAASGSGAAGTGTHVDADTGAVVSNTGTGSAGTVYALPVAVSKRSGQDSVMAVLTAAEILVALAIPALLGRRLRRRT